MLFNSIHFLMFFLAVIFVYFSLPHKYRWVLLLISSYYFYMSWKAEYVILIMISTLIDYFAALGIYSSKTKFKRNSFLTLSLLVNLGLLFAFKYFNFVSDSIAHLLGLFSIQFSPHYLNVLLPVGISFYTFQTIGYTLDVYKKKIKPEKHLGIFAVYVSFFPQLVAGPIERAKNLMPQFFEKHKIEYSRVISGLQLMLWGFFLKIVLADRLSILVDQVFNNPFTYSGFPLLLASIFFSFQIYGDFAGYSLIAIGAAKIMGFDLMTNFRRPYLAKSIESFWRRWHISLSTWFRDYIYIPLGGKKVKVRKWIFNILIVFLISGLWHGAAWNFIIWASLHSVYFIFAVMTKDFRKNIAEKINLKRFSKLTTLFNIALTFLLVTLGWIFFRANSVQDAIYISTHVFSNFSLSLSGINLGLGWDGLLIALLLIGFVMFVQMIQEIWGIKKVFYKLPKFLRMLIYALIILAILLFGVFENSPFIYFQF